MPEVPQLDTRHAHSARVYNYWLGGQDNFAADREAAEQAIAANPGIVADVRANREFLARAVRYLAAECGVRQFLDVGAGLPTANNTHQVAQAVAPDARVVYVDNDPLVLTHARALLTSTPQGAVQVVDGDLREPETILAQASRTLDFTKPTAILLLAVLHFLPGSNGPAEIVARLASALAPGSFVAISHLTGDLAPEQVAAAIEAYNTCTQVPVTARTHAQVTGLFGGLPLLAPGVVPITQWRPRIGLLPEPADLHAGVARVPHPRMGIRGWL